MVFDFCHCMSLHVCPGVVFDFCHCMFLHVCPGESFILASRLAIF